MSFVIMIGKRSTKAVLLLDLFQLSMYLLKARSFPCWTWSVIYKPSANKITATMRSRTAIRTSSHWNYSTTSRWKENYRWLLACFCYMQKWHTVCQLSVLKLKRNLHLICCKKVGFHFVRNIQFWPNFLCVYSVCSSPRLCPVTKPKNLFKILQTFLTRQNFTHDQTYSAKNRRSRSLLNIIRDSPLLHFLSEKWLLMTLLLPRIFGFLQFNAQSICFWNC